MKAGREHRVPLSPRALEVLDGAAELFDGQTYVRAISSGKILKRILRERVPGPAP